MRSNGSFTTAPDTVKHSPFLSSVSCKSFPSLPQLEIISYSCAALFMLSAGAHNNIALFKACKGRIIANGIYSYTVLAYLKFNSGIISVIAVICSIDIEAVAVTLKCKVHMSLLGSLRQHLRKAVGSGHLYSVNGRYSVPAAASVAAMGVPASTEAMVAVL